MLHPAPGGGRYDTCRLFLAGIETSGLYVFFTGSWTPAMTKFFYSFGIIFFGLSCGYLLQHLARRGRIRLPLPVDALRKRLQRFALLFLNPVAIIGALWTLRFKDAGLILMPLVGFFALTIGGVLALAVARILQLKPKEAGALFGCGSFTNIGSIGALICYVFLGEPGFALVPLYKLFEEISYYGIGFPIAKYYSGADAEQENAWSRLKSLARDPFIMVALSSIVIGLVLNFSGISRPTGYASVIAVFVPLATVLLLTSIGLALRVSRVMDSIKACLAVSLIKFLLVPLAATGLAFSLGFYKMENGLPLKVVLILSSMPVAFNALIPPSIYDLDLDLANSCWFVTTALLVPILPILLALIRNL